MIRNNFRAGLLALASGLCLAASAQAQTTSFTEGDILLAFRATSGQGNDRAFLINLGPATAFNSNFTLSLGTGVGSTLTTTFGADWFTRFDSNTNRNAIQIALIGSNRTGSGPGAIITLFTSNQLADAYNVAGGATQGVARTTILGVTTSFAGQTAVAGVPQGYVQLNNEVNSYSSQQDGSTSFGYFNPSNEVNPGSPIFLNQLVSNIAGGPGTTLGSFSIDGSGGVAFAVPEPSTYAMGAIASIALLVFWRRRANRTA